MADALIDRGSDRRVTFVWGTGVVIAVGAVIALALWIDDRKVEDPAGDAEAAYRELMLEIETRAADPVVTAPDTLAPDPVEPESRRDLFSPAAPRPDVAAAIPRVKRPRIPALSGILIDGSARQAVLDGEVFAVGEQIRGFQVLEIDSDAVVLGRAGSTHRLAVGGDR
jgi:hypothetical protein